MKCLCCGKRSKDQKCARCKAIDKKGQQAFERAFIRFLQNVNNAKGQ